MDLLQAVVDVLRVPDTLPQKNRDHNLTGKYAGCRECHIQPDWLLIYRQTDTELYLVSTVARTPICSACEAVCSITPSEENQNNKRGQGLMKRVLTSFSFGKRLPAFLQNNLRQKT
jgi:addiction module toxin, relE/stbE family